MVPKMLLIQLPGSVVLYHFQCDEFARHRLRTPRGMCEGIKQRLQHATASSTLLPPYFAANESTRMESSSSETRSLVERIVRRHSCTT